MTKVSTTGIVVSLKTDLRFPVTGQQGHGRRIIQGAERNRKNYRNIESRSQILVHQSTDSAREHHDTPFMDKQNEGIKDPEVKVIPYDMGG